MDFFNYIIRRILNKIPLKLLLLFLILLFSLFLFKNYCFAVEPPPNNDLSTIQGICNGLDNRVFAVTGVDISNFNNWYFFDSLRNCYHIVVFNENKTAIYNFTNHSTKPLNGTYDVCGWTTGTANIILYSIDYDTFNVTAKTVEVTGDTSFNTMFNMPYTFNIFNFMYVKCNPSYVYGDSRHTISWNTTLTNKITPIEPYVQYSLDNTNIIIGDKIIIKPGNTEYSTNTYLKFSIELWNSDALDLAEGVPYLSIPFSTEHSYWNSTDKQFEIPYSDYLSLWLTNNENYTIYINMFTDDYFYTKYEAVNFDYINDNIIPIGNNNSGNPESSIPNYSNDINNINSSINNSNVDDMTSDFSNLADGFTVNDPTGLDTIFQKLYNAFCTDNIINVTFTLPYINKTVTISTQNISSYFPQAVKDIVSVFVWGLIGLWVLKDIRTIIDKISEGSPEDVGSDVKKEVL